MFLRILSVMLIALAMLAAPLTMGDGAAMASPPATAHHRDASAMSGHCDEQPAPDQDKSHKATGSNCCVATCVAVVTPAGAAELAAYHPLTERPTSDADRLGTLAEIATPPPRPA